MTHKEKAEELINKFYGLPTGNTNRCVDWLTATESALIAVDEILKVSISYAGKDYDYWQEVKNELNKQDNEK
jgi:hypothetical protein